MISPRLAWTDKSRNYSCGRYDRYKLCPIPSLWVHTGKYVYIEINAILSVESYFNCTRLTNCIFVWNHSSSSFEKSNLIVFVWKLSQTRTKTPSNEKSACRSWSRKPLIKNATFTPLPLGLARTGNTRIFENCHWTFLGLS